MKKKILLGLLYFAPLAVFAQQGLQFLPGFSGAPPGSGGGSAPTNIQNLINILNNLINAIIPFLIALAFLFFVFGVVKYLVSAENEESRKASRHIMIWSIIAVFVIVSFWGLVAVLTGTFGFQNVSQSAVPIPKATP